MTLVVLVPVMDDRNLDTPWGEFAAITDREINRPDNHARCTCRRKETNEQTHNRRRVIYTDRLDAIATNRLGRSQSFLSLFPARANLVTSYAN